MIDLALINWIDAINNYLGQLCAGSRGQLHRLLRELFNAQQHVQRVRASGQSRKEFRIESVPITTVYSDEVSSIHPVRDTIRFFKLMRRYR